MERLITHMNAGDLWKPWQCGHNTQTCVCGMVWRLNGTKWAIIQNSMPRLHPKGCFPCFLSKGTEAKGQSHIYCLWWCCDSWFPLPLILFPIISSSPYYYCVFLRGHIPTLWPDWIWVLSVVTLSTSTAEIPNSFMPLSGGSSSQGTPTSLPVFLITDKLWQMGSGECLLHTHMISAITLVLPPSPHSAPRVSREDSYQCEEVTDGNASLIWRACTLLFIFSRQWQGIYSKEWGRCIS